MIYIYTAVIAAILILILASGRYKKQVFKQLDTSKHPLKFLYPASARPGKRRE